MGNGDRRKSLKMRRRKSRLKHKIRHTYTGAKKTEKSK